MTSDFEAIPGVPDLACGRIGEEFCFTFPAVLDAIRLCTAKEIAVLGVELFEVRPGGYATTNLSLYEREVGTGPKGIRGWVDYVKANNVRATDFVSRNPGGDDHIYVLTTASWKEFRE